MAVTFSNGAMFLTSALANAYPITFSCWFNPSSVTVNQYLMAISSSTTANNYFALQITTTGKAVCLVDSAGTMQSATSTASLTVGTWYHLCAVFQSATSRFIYLNNVSTQSVTSSTPTAGNLNRTVIGGIFNGSTTLAGSVQCKGTMAWAGIWKIDCAASDVSGLFNNASPRLIQPGNLLAYTRLVGTSPDMDLLNAGGWAYSTAQTVAANNLVFFP